MLRLEKIKRTYNAGNTIVHALDEVSISFRRNEFVSVLGPSGSGKTTLLNIVGGLDKYDGGDLIIAGKSTKNFKDRDWDFYRNQRVGFVFQAYNLIPHQTILGNVELALTISGVSKKDRKVRALKALEEVGLKGLEHKKPNQLSGGQCQRVAIARALVNEPEILLADEPTGALDTATSEQIMALIKRIAKDRLVVMVTHNPDIANRYSTRIINLLDGKVISDSDPFSSKDEIKEINSINKEILFKHSKAKMNWPTAIALSTKNLISKIKRTTLVCIAGSIGIIGVSSVLAVSNGISKYIESMQDDMLSSYPLQISEKAVDYSALMSGLSSMEKVESLKVEDGNIGVDSMVEYLMDKYTDFTSVKTNDINQNLIDFIEEMPREAYASINYSYGIDMTNNIFTSWNDDTSVKNVSLNGLTQIYIAELNTVNGFEDYSQFVSLFTNFMKQTPGDKDYIIGDGKNGQYDLLCGEFADDEDELMLVVDSNQTLTDILFAQLGLFGHNEFLNLAKRAIEENEETPDLEKIKSYTYPESFSYEELLNKEFTYFPHDTIYSDTKDLLGTKDVLVGGNMYQQTIYGYNYPAIQNESWTNGVKLHISGILKPNENTKFGCLERGLYFNPKFGNKYMQDSIDSRIVGHFIDSLKNPSGIPGGDLFTTYVTFPYQSYKNNNEGESTNGFASALNFDLGSSMSSMFSMSSGEVDYFEINKLYLRAISGLGIKLVPSETDATFSRTVDGLTSYYKVEHLPNLISIYPRSFKAKTLATNYLDKWNSSEDLSINGKVILSSERDELTYTDTIEMIVNVINTLIKIITTALISFTSLALVVSCFMIAVITYISVVERVKEIGVIRSLGGRKKDVTNLFVAETFIIGLASGLIGIGVTYALCFVLNIILGANGIPNIGVFNPIHALIMVSLSFFLTVLSGLIPSRNASKQNPVDALRSE